MLSLKRQYYGFNGNGKPLWVFARIKVFARTNILL